MVMRRTMSPYTRSEGGADTSGTVARALAVLTVMAERGGSVGVKDVATSLALPMSTSHRLLDLLRHAGFVEKNESLRRYVPGLQLIRIAHLVIQSTTYSSVFQPALDRITAATCETAVYCEYWAENKVCAYVAKSDSRQPLRYRIDLFEPVPVECGASGRAILSFLDEDVRTGICASPRPSPLHARCPSGSALARQIKTTRQTGFAFSQGEKLQDSIGIAVPVRLSSGGPIGSLTLTIPESRFAKSKLKSYVELLSHEARLLSRS